MHDHPVLRRACSLHLPALHATQASRDGRVTEQDNRAGPLPPVPYPHRSLTPGPLPRLIWLVRMRTPVLSGTDKACAGNPLRLSVSGHLILRVGQQ
jgi:hypothetical protein